MIKLIPETKISKPKIDTDETILLPTMTGEISKGGLVTSTKKVFKFIIYK